MSNVSINEAALRLGVSPDTVRRHVRCGSLPGYREQTPQGYQWRIELSDELEKAALDPHLNRIQQLEETVAALRQSLDMAREELRARRNEVRRLLNLLDQRPSAGTPIAANGSADDA